MVLSSQHFFAAATLFQDNTYLANGILILLGCIVSYIVLLDDNIQRGAVVFRLAVIWILIWAVGYHISSVNFEKDMRSYYGRLYPSNISMIDKRCGPGDDTVLFSGPNTFQTTQYPYTFLYIDGKPIISLGKNGNAITIDYLLLNDTNGDSIVHIDKDEFWIKPTVERLIIPDRSRLEIAGRTGDKALKLYFMNSTHLYIAGKFTYHDFIVDIGNSGIDITLPNGKHLVTLNDNCFYNHQLFVTTAGLDAISPTKGTTELRITP